jgi:hypothetical protein
MKVHTDPLVVYWNAQNDPSFPGGLPSDARPVPTTVKVIEPEAFANFPAPPVIVCVSVKPKEPVVLLKHPVLPGAAVPLL